MTDPHLAILLDRFVRRIHVNLKRKAPEFDTERIGPGGAIVLLTLDEMGRIPMQVLAESLVRDKSQMTRTVRSLEAKGLIAREQSLTDSRVCLISLTVAGRDVVATHQHAIADTIGALLTPLTDADRKSLQDLLKRAVSPKAAGSPD